MPVQSIWHTVSPSFTRVVASRVMQKPEDLGYICDSHAPLWVLTSHVFCITYCVMEWSSISSEMCVWVDDLRLQLGFQQTSGYWTTKFNLLQIHPNSSGRTANVTGRDDFGVVLTRPGVETQHVNCRVTRKPTAMLKPSAITAKAKTACEALYSCSRGIMEVEHGYI